MLGNVRTTIRHVTGAEAVISTSIAPGKGEPGPRVPAVVLSSVASLVRQEVIQLRAVVLAPGKTRLPIHRGVQGAHVGGGVRGQRAFCI